MDALNVPNVLTLLRLIAVPVFAVLLLGGRNVEALIVFVAAGSIGPASQITLAPATTTGTIVKGAFHKLAL